MKKTGTVPSHVENTRGLRRIATPPCPARGRSCRVETHRSVSSSRVRWRVTTPMTRRYVSRHSVSTRRVLARDARNSFAIGHVPQNRRRGDSVAVRPRADQRIRDGSASRNPPQVDRGVRNRASRATSAAPLSRWRRIASPRGPRPEKPPTHCRGFISCISRSSALLSRLLASSNED